MTESKVLAWIILILVIGAVIFSIVSMYYGRLEQAMIFTPLLVVLYIFGLGVQKKTDVGPRNEESEDEDQDHDNPSGYQD
jgi:uroporphyrinogen-III decarboxylase